MILIINLLNLKTNDTDINDHVQLLFDVLLTYFRDQWADVENIDTHISALKERFETAVKRCEVLSGPTATTLGIMESLRSLLEENDVSIFKSLKTWTRTLNLFVENCHFGKNIFLINESIKSDSCFNQTQLNNIFSSRILNKEVLNLEERKLFEDFIKDGTLPADNAFLQEFLSILPIMQEQKTEGDLIKLASSLKNAIFLSKKDNFPIFGILVEGRLVSLYIFCDINM
ncbi:hypothetical protein BD770DRAFT_427286 [Pilaira anomala]|nr:hypothetical protein BD770DRAFT_427286 [Pilaira anomala]